MLRTILIDYLASYGQHNRACQLLSESSLQPFKLPLVLRPLPLVVQFLLFPTLFSLQIISRLFGSLRIDFQPSQQRAVVHVPLIILKGLEHALAIQQVSGRNCRGRLVSLGLIFGVAMTGCVDLMRRLDLQVNSLRFFIDVCGEKTPTAEFDEAACPCGRG